VSFSQALLRRLRSYARDAVVLAKVDLKALDGLSTQTFYASTAPVITPGGQAWDPLILSAGPIGARGAYGATEIVLVTASLVLANRRLGFQTSGTLLNLVSAYRFIGSAVTLYLWERGGTTFPDGQVFSGIIIGCETSVDGLSLSLRQRTDWNRPVALKYVNRQDYPRAPDGTVGLPLPVKYGFNSSRPMRRPWTVPNGGTNPGFGYFGNDLYWLRLLSGPRGLGGAVLADSGRGGTATVNKDARVLVAGHKCSGVFDTSTNQQGGYLVWMEAGGRPAVLATDSSHVVNSDEEAGVTIDDGWVDTFARVGLPPVEVLPVVNTAKHPRQILEPSDTTFAYLDQSASYLDLQMRLPSLPDIGEPIDDAWHVIGYRTSSDCAGVRMGLYNDAGSALGTTFTLDPQPSTTPAFVARNDLTGSYFPDSPWAWGTDRILRVFFDPTASPAGWIEVYFAGLAIDFKPRKDVVETDRFMGRYRTVPPKRSFLRNVGPYQIPILEGATTEVRGKFFANTRGLPDDGSGTYTGTGGSLIERMPDIVHHLLATVGQQSAGQIELAPGGFGSFTDARNILRDFSGQDLHYAMNVAERADLMAALGWLTQSAFVMPVISPLDDKWRLVVWRDAIPADYTYTFGPDDIVGPRGLEVALTPLSQVVSGVKVAYSFNGLSGAYDHESTVAHDRSVSGYEFRNLRDEDLTVVAGVNDRLNWFNITNRTATLTPGDYTPETFREHVRSVMKAEHASPYHVSYGGLITSGYQDKIDYTISAVTYAATLNPGDYTMEGLATEVARAMNAQGPGGFSCSYSRTTRKFTISNGTSFTLRTFTGANPNEQALAQLGYAFTDVTGTSLVGDAEREEGYFSLQSISTFRLLFQSGADGSDSAVAARTCAELLGFSSEADPTIDFDYRGASPKGNLELVMKSAADRYGARRELSIEGRAIYDTRSARDLRNRMATVFSRPHVQVTFATERAPDMERGRVIQFSSEFDALVPYPEPDTDGLWAGKSFAVVECEQDLGPATFMTRIVAVSVSSIGGPWGESWGTEWGAY